MAGHDPTAPASWRPNPSLRRYLTWLEGQPSGLSLRGVGGADIELRLDEVYVPLRLSRSRSCAMDPAGLSGSRRFLAPESDDLEFELEELFARLETCKHALLLGDPGSGKTTALRKLSERALHRIRRATGAGGEEPPTLHLDDRFVPVFARLRSFTRADLEGGLREFVARELTEVSARSEHSLDNALITALWRHGRLLLLLDGLDEVADPDLRAALCRFLDEQLAASACARLRVVITSRFTGYDGERVRLSPKMFAHVELRPLSSEQASLLVTRWFLEASERLESFSRHEARLRAAKLSEALKDPRFDHHRRAMYATPLILTLLCVVIQRGCEMPRKRAEFYDTCLRTLLERWEQAKDGQADLSAEDAIELLRPIAFAIHESGKREQLEKDELLLQIGDRLEELGVDNPAAFEAVFTWLHERAGVLVELAPGEFGFFHLGVQEYLAALHIASDGDDAVAALAGRFGESWWEEVILLAVSIPRQGVFTRLMERVLDGATLTDQKTWALLRQCVLEASSSFDPAPFIRRFLETPPRPPAELHALLQLVRGIKDRRLLDAARELAARTKQEVIRGAARQLVAAGERSHERDTPFDIAVLGLAEEQDQVAALVAKLRATSLRVWPEDGLAEPLEQRCWREVRAAVERVAVVVGATAPWAVKSAETCLRLLGKHRPLVGVLAGGAADEVERVGPKEFTEWVDMRTTWDVSALGGTDNIQEFLVGELESVFDLLPDFHLIAVPGGRFLMGGESETPVSQPAHWVRLSPYWIGQTPVTNRQYGVFLEASGHRRPRFWRDRRLSDPELPVVGVSWDDAMAFCRWLHQQTGWSVDLPSEAQWEFAARGTDGRRYAWGNDPPDATRGCFGTHAHGRPAVVGSYPAGAGPFGTLDQGGLVWEWCKDVWDATVYKKRVASADEPLNPWVRGEQASRRHSLRGTSWGMKGALAAAYRGRDFRKLRSDDDGFRVLVTREPVDPNS